MKNINKILCKTTDFVCGLPEFVGMTVGRIVKYAIICTFIFAAMVAIALLWLSIPVGICTLIFGDLDKPITSQSEAAGMLIVIAVWVILSKIVYDRLPNGK